jgi:spermidine/putrescine transport system permease protein
MNSNQSTLGKWLFPSSVFLIYLFLYFPILVLMLFSFNIDPQVFYWKGFTTKWYFKLLKEVEIWDAFKNSILVALAATCFSVSMGTLLVCFASRRTLRNVQPLFFGILAMPEIVIAVSMLSIFSFFGVPFGFTTLIAGHTLLGLGYVVPIVYSRFIELDKRIMEAAYDLGATRGQVIRTIVIPLLRPALLAGGLLTFIVSFDDFVFSFFCAGGSAQTLPIYIFAMIKTGASPVIAVISTLLLLMSSLLACVVSLFHIRKVGVIR